jgi:hypothetical protein
MHGKGNASIGASVGYLTAYAESLQVGEGEGKSIRPPSVHG